ncbi:LanC-like protein GCR2 [Euphorbia peplus]|nr:LanC-like protein GCR2 [Euphorbia peplus]
MGDRHFQNLLPETERGDDESGSSEMSNDDSLIKFISLPNNMLSDTLISSALHLKDMVVQESWVSIRKPLQDYSLYTGLLGTAFLLFKSFQLTNNTNDLQLSSRILNACDSASLHSGRVTFLCGRAGVCALGAVIAKHAGDESLLNHYLTQFREIKLPSELPCELLYGRAGFLWACSFLNNHIGKQTVSTTRTRGVVDDIIKSGRNLAHGGICPLMYEWHGKKYWGAAHGLAGIMYVLMDMELKQDEIEDVKRTLHYMINNRFPSGNYPSSEGNTSDRLVHWCHGAPGIALTLVKAAEVFGDKEFLQAAVEAGDVVWKRGLLKRVGICHGISGNAYVFLSLYRLTGDLKYLHRAKAFTCFLHEKAQTLISEGKMHGGDRPYSLFEGIGGMAYLFLDMIHPSQARFPAYEL